MFKQTFGDFRFFSSDQSFFIAGKGASMKGLFFFVHRNLLHEGSIFLYAENRFCILPLSTGPKVGVRGSGNHCQKVRGSETTSWDRRNLSWGMTSFETEVPPESFRNSFFVSDLFSRILIFEIFPKRALLKFQYFLISHFGSFWKSTTRPRKTKIIRVLIRGFGRFPTLSLTDFRRSNKLSEISAFLPPAS